MDVTRDLRVGYIPYLNCAPFFHYLKDCGFSGEIVTGVPSRLNQMLQNGTIDISPSSSFEYALNSNDYLLLPGHSISSCGPVKSVLLFSPCPLAELQNRKIGITGESATSINLLRVLLLEFAGLTTVDDYVPEGTVESLVQGRQPALLIGDRAMQQAREFPAGMSCFDLGEIWYQKTGLPFVFALWILRRESADAKSVAVAALQMQLADSIRQAFNNLSLLAAQNGASDVEVARLVEYWQTIDYSLGDEHLKGLELFFSLCQKHGLLQNVPKIAFFRAI